jgi:hypothetical protein
MEVVWKVRGQAVRPEPLVVTRRYARSTPRPEPEPITFEPFMINGSAMDSITLDLGDLPDLPDWPDVVVDLDDLPDLPDLPDWPPEMAPQR